MFFIESRDKEKRINVSHIVSFDLHESNPNWFKVHYKIEYDEARKMSCKHHGVFAVLTNTKTEIDIPRFRSEADRDSYFYSKYNVNPDLYGSAVGICVYEGTLEECKTYIQEQQNLLEMRYWLSHLFAGILGGLITLLIRGSI